VLRVKPQFEHVSIPNGCSIRVFNRQIPEIPFEWHHHPEWELTLTLNSRGLRFIADHIGAYDSHDLVLVPSEAPHTWASTKAIDESKPHVAIVVWFTEPWALQMADVCPEYSSLRKLLRRAAGGLSFPSSAGETMATRMSGLLSNTARERLQTVLDLLSELADTDAVPLATPPKGAPPITADDSAQLNRILNLLHKQFADPIRVQDLCAVGNMSERSLHRLFVRHLGENLTDYLGRLRIGRVCMSLVETDRPISVIAAEAGFSNLSNFNRRFRTTRHMSPKEFRRFYLEHGRMPELDQFDLTKRSPSLEKAKRRNIRPTRLAVPESGSPPGPSYRG
jgi:AraC-like DNA-binding protein